MGDAIATRRDDALVVVDVLLPQEVNVVLCEDEVLRGAFKHC